ncbi:twitchin-like isoform X2 [Argopecten irradians]|uniref:twitchin-like isoform X2 n=1 Tax=Argopecten irradians TaxID=31199 RepID=UPI0037138FEF
MKDLADDNVDDKYKRDRKKYDDLDDDKDSGYQRKPRDSMKDLADDNVDDKYKRDRKKYDDLDDDTDSGYQKKPRDTRKDLADDNVDDKYKRDRKKYDDLDEDKEQGYQRKPRDSMKDINDKDVDGVNKKDKDFDDKYSRRLSKPKYGDDDDEYFGKNKTSDAASSENNNENMTKRRNNKTLPDVHVGEEKCADLMTDEQVGKSAGNADRRTPSPRRPESLPIEKIMPDVTDDMRNGKPEPEHYRKSSGQMMGSGKTDTMEDKLIQKAKEVTAEIKTLNDAWMTDDNKSSGEPSPLGRIEDTKPELSNTFFIGVIPSDLQTTEQDESRSDEIRGVDDRVGDLGQNKHALNTLPDRNAIRHAKARSGRQPESHTDEVESILNADELHLVNTNQGHVGKLSTQNDSLLESAGQTGKIDTLVGYTYNEYDDDTPGSEGQNETTQDGIVGSDPRLVSKTKYGTPSLVDEMFTDNDKDKSPDDIPGLHYGQAIAEDVPIKKRGVSVHFEDEMCEALDVLKPVDSEPERKTPSDNDTGLANKDALIDSELNETSKRPTDSDVLSFSTSADIKEGKDAQMPRILKASSDVTIYEGQNLEINWEIQGTPEPRMKIYKNGEPIELFDGMEIVQNDHKWTLSIPDVIRDDAGSYELHIMNKHGTDKSEVKVQVHRQTPRTLQKDLAAPVLTSPQPTNTAVKDGDDLILKCSVQGFPPPQVLWLRDGEELSDGDDVEILEEKGDQCLIVWEARPEHSGHYICRAVNSQGSSEVKFDVDVQDWSTEEDNSCENDTKSSKPGKKEKSKTDQFQKDEPSELPKDQFGKKEMPKVSEKPNEKTQRPVVEEEVISSKTENVSECLPEAGDDDIEMSVSKKEDIPPKPAPKPKDKVRKPVVKEFIEEQAENLNANLPINGEEAILLTTLDKKDLAKASVKSEQRTEAGVVEDTIVDRADTLQQSSVVEQGSVSTVGNKEDTIISVNSPEGSRTSSVENVENQDNKCTPFGEPESLSIKTVKDDKVPKVAAKPKLQSKTPVVEELLQDDSDRLKDHIPLGDAEQATVTTVKTETVPKVATKPTEKSKTLASVDGKKEDDLPSEKKVTTDKKNKDTNIDLGGKKDDLDRQEKQDTLDKLSKSLGMDDLDQGSLSLGELDDDNSKQSTCEVKGQHRNRYHGDTADLVDGDLDGEPMMPAIELHMSNSDEMCTKKYMVVASYHDTTNDVHLESGEVIELLNKMVPTHWLVRKLDDKQQACYVPAALLQSRRDTDARPTPEGMAKAISKSKQAVQDLVDTEEDYICDLRDLIDNYHDPLQDGSKEEFPEKLLEKKEEIFGNLMDLYNFHNKDLLPELMACADNPNQVAEVFLDRRESLKQYLPFWAGREKADKDMNSEEIQAFLQSYSKHIGDPDNAFQDLLNRPVERIHEYINLLKNLMKYTSQAGGDCSQLMSVVQMLDDLCQEVDNIMLLDSVQGYQGNIHELGPVIRHESAKMWEGDPNNSEPREREVFLFGDSILLASALEQDEDGEPKKLQFERIIKLRNTDIDHDGFADSRRLEFWDLEDTVKDNSEPLFTLDTKSPYSKQAWVRAIKEAQTQLGVDNTANMPERRKIKTSKHKVVSSTPRKGSKVVRAEDVERDSPFDDFNILDTSTEAVGVQPEFDDGTSRPVFQMKLEKTVVEEGATAQMECVVAGIPPPKVLWLKNNRPLMATDRCRVIVDGDTNILEFPRARADDTAVYSARAMNVNGSTISTAELYVGDAQPSDLLKYREGIPDNEFRTPAYFFQMKNCQVEQGRLARFDCRVVAYPKPDIIWMKDGKVLTSGERYKLLNFNDEIYSLLIQSVETDDEGRYTCWAHNKYGEAMTEAYLNVLALQDNMDDDDMAPKFLTKFYDQTVTEGVPCDLQCMIAGKPQPSVQWLHNNSELMATPDIAIVNQANFCSLKIKEVSKSHAGKYACLLKNGLGEASCSAGITVIDKKIKGVPMLPKFLKKLCDVTAKTNEDFELEVVVVGEPKPKVTWQYNHKPISGSHRRMRKSHEGDVYRLTISDVRLEDDGKFTCKAANSEGEVFCSCNLLVKESRIQSSEEPSFTQKDFDARYGCAPTFLKKMEDISAPSGQSAKFECRIMGIPEPSVKWFKNSVPLTPGKKYWISQDSAGNCGLQVYDVTTGDEGIYTCTLTNPAGEISTNASLRIGKPKESMERDRASMGRRLSRDDMLDSTRAPTMPRDEPMLKSTRPDAVRLSWSPAPTSGLPKDARNIRYLVESKALPNADWKTIGDGVHSNTFMAKNLNPDKEYAFRVRAANQFGQSEPTQPARLERIKLDIDEPIEKRKVILPESKRPPSLPSTRPVITDYGQESVRLAWKPTPPPVTIKKPLPVSYRVEAQELPNTDWLPMASGLSTPSYYLPQLQDRHDYNIRVRAENKYGVSEPSEPLWLPRAQSFPGVPIRRPEIVEMEPEFVKLSWERVDVPPTALDEEPLTYMLEMQEPAVRDWREIARDIHEPHYTVRDLRPGNDYRFRVRSRSVAGPLSEPSPATSLYRTLATTRAPIDRLQLDDHEFDTEGINLSWNRVNIPPYHRDDEPLLYSVEMMEQPIDDWRPVVSGIPTQRFRVTDLAPDRDYKFRVRALSSYGISPPSYALPVSYRRPLSSPSRPLLDHTPRLLYDDTDSLALAWQPPTLDSTRPLRYRVQMQAPPSMDWRTMASDIPDTRYRISGLGPSRDYLFRVVPETSLGQLDPLPPVSLSSLPTPRMFHPSRPEILDIEPTSLGLSWKRPVVDMYTPLTYNIEMQEPPSLSWRNVHSGLTDTHYRVGGLQPSRDYMFRVVPVTASGQLEPLPPVSISSMPVIPRMQHLEPSMTEMGRDSIKLSWRPAEIPFYRRQPIPLHYTVEMRTLPSSEWIPVARRVKDTSYIVKGLNPKNDYEFRVKAETDYGCSSPTTPVIVRRKPVPVFPRREPIISNVSPDSIALSWQPASLPGHSTRIPVYQIEVQDPPSIGQWRPLTNNVSQTSYNVMGLRPDRDYLFRVRAKLDGALGEPTLPVYLMRRCGPPRMPTDHPYVHDIQPTSVRLQWRSVELSPRHTDYSPVTYRLEIQEGTRSDWVTLAGRIPHTDFHVTNLTPDQEYSFRVRAENKYGVSEPTNLVHIKRRAVAPTLPQDEPLLYDVGAGSITLSWRSAGIPSYNTSPVTYTIFAQESPSGVWAPMARRIPHTWYVLNGIRPDRDYTFRVQAENEFGVSRPTLPVRLFHTEYKAPIELPEIDEFDEKTSSVNLRWRPRSMTPFASEPLRYHVESWEPRKRVWRRLASDIPETSYRVTGVSSNQENIFRVRAQTKAALSEPTYPISLSKYLFPIRRPQLHDLDSEAVRLSWSPYQYSRPRIPSLPHLPSVPRRYEVELRELGSSDWRSVATVPDTSYHYRGLRPRQDYQFRIRGISDQGPLDVYSSPVTLYRRTALPRVPLSRPEIMSVQDETVDLSWSRVDVPATQYDETPLTYIIESQQLPGYDWTPLARGIPDTSYRVTGLRRNQDYAFRIRGELPSGLSEPSPYVPVYRRPMLSDLIFHSQVRAGVPIARPELSALTPSSAHLRWNRVYLPPYDLPNLPISYQVEVQDLPHRRWRPLARGIRMEEYEVKDMSPDKDYMFRIRAETPDGDLSEPTPPIPYYRTHEPREHEPRRQADLTILKEEFSVPNRSYVEHLTTYIPPRLPIDKPELREISQDTVSLSWKPAKVPEKIRSSSNLTYVIECRTPPNYEWRELKSGLTTTSSTLNNLHPRMDYMFRVRAHNQYGFSEASLPISLFRPIELDDDDVEYDDYDDEYRNTYNDTVPRSRLQKRTEEAPMKIDEAPPKLPMETPKITDHGESAHLSWLPARIPAYAKKTPITYIVEVKEPPVQGWARTASGIVDTSFMVEGILPNRDYQFRIRAETQFGTSDPTLSAVLDRTKAQIQDTIEDEDDLEDYKPRKKPLVKKTRPTDPSSPLSPVNDFRPRKRLSKYASRLEGSHIDQGSDEDVFAPTARQSSSKYSSSSRSYDRQSLRSTTSIDEDLYSRPKHRPSKPPVKDNNLNSDEDEDMSSKSRFSKYSSRNQKSSQMKDYSLEEEDYLASSKYSKYSSRNKKSSLAANYSSEEEDYLPRSRLSKYTQPKRYSLDEDVSEEEDYMYQPKSRTKLRKKYSLDDDLSDEEYVPFRPRYSSRNKRDDLDFFDDEPYSSRYRSRNHRSSFNDDSYESVIKSKFRSRRHTTDISPLSMEAAELRSRRHHDDMPLSADSMSHGFWTRTSPPRTLDLPFTREFLEILKGSMDKKDKKPTTYSPDAPSSYKPADKPSPWQQESSASVSKEKSRRSSRDKRRNDPDDLPQAVYLDSVLTGVPPRMPSSRPMITNQAGNLLTLAWLPARVPSYVKGSNMTYLVEMRKPPSHLWLKLIDNVEETEFDVYDLQEEQDYMFRVKAKNEFGCSEPTMPLSIIRNKDDYIGTAAALSRSGSRGSLDSPWSRSRASSVDSLLESMPTKACKPEFKLRDDTFYGAESRPVTISLQVKGFPLPKLRWYFQGRKLKLGNRYKSCISPNGLATLEFSRMSEKDVGEYKCRAENDQGMGVRIFNLEMSDAPIFLEPVRNIVVDHRGRAKLECRVDGIPSPTVKFMRDWRPVTESSRVKIVHEAPDYWCLTIDNVMSSDCGQYQCVAENVSGKAVSSAKITVEERLPHSPGLHYREAPVEDFYYILEELGRGRHGVVRRVLDKSSGKQYAAKFIPVADPEMKHFFRQELYNLRAASHKNVVDAVDAFQSNRSLVIITELATGGELLDRVLSLDNWTESDAAFFTRQLLEVLKHLHQHNVYHLDIKPSNILLSASDSDEIKLIDFGLSRRVLPDQTVRCNYGTPEFTSPEQVCNEALSSATDIWSVGALAYLLVSGISAFQDRTEKDILSWVETCDWEFDDEGFELVSKEAKDFISKLLILEPSERLTLEECLDHAWIKNATNRGQGSKLNIEHLATFHKQNKKERLLGALQTCARVQSLKAIINDDIEEEDTGLYPLKDKASGELIYPDSENYGKFLDQESWADWQVRYHQGGDTLLVPLAEPDYTARVREYKEAMGESDNSEEGSSDGTMKERRSLKDVEKEYVSSSNPCLQKELEWALVAEEFKQQQQTPEELFDKEQVDPAKLPLFATKLRDHAFMPGETVTLTCKVQSEGTPSVNWFRNEEQVSEGNRLRTSLSEDGTATLTIELSKPFDEGVYKCVARNQTGKSTSWARVLVGGVTEEPGRPVVVQVSGTEALLVWEPPMADCNTPVTGYRVDYRKFGDETWTVAANVIDECCLVTGLLQGRSYRFRVSCVNKFGISPYSVASTEVKTRTDPDAKITVDKYMAALLARQREVETRPSPASSRKGSEISSSGLTLVEGSPEDTYSFLNTLYSGGFSDLVCCRKSGSNTLYLGKIVPVQHDNMDATKHEYELLKSLSHERVVSLYESYLYKDSLYMVLEFLYGLNVIQHLSFKTKYTEDMVARVMRQVLDGVEYLQHQGVVHLNLQPSSIVMASRRHLDIKLVDFSLARNVTKTGEVVAVEGFPEFIAPEVVAKEQTSFPADIWTIGTLAFLLLSGESPFAAPTQKDTYSNIVYNRYDAHGLYENATREALKFVFQILKRTPRNRLTATGCLEDKWLQVTDVMTKCRKEVVFSTSKLRTFSRRYLINRDLEMYPMIHEETPLPVSEEPEFDEEEEEEEDTTSHVLDETEEASLKESDSKEQPISLEVTTVDEPIENDVIPESDESVETEVTLSVPAEETQEGQTIEGIEQLATDIVSSAMDEALQAPESSPGEGNSEA